MTPDLRWNTHVKEIFKKAMSRMWLLRRLKLVKLEPETILDYYIKEIRPIVEHGVEILI